jgi:hypothetical protein
LILDLFGKLTAPPMFVSDHGPWYSTYSSFTLESNKFNLLTSKIGYGFLGSKHTTPLPASHPDLPQCALPTCAPAHSTPTDNFRLVDTSNPELVLGTLFDGHLRSERRRFREIAIESRQTIHQTRLDDAWVTRHKGDARVPPGKFGRVQDVCELALAVASESTEDHGLLGRVERVECNRAGEFEAEEVSKTTCTPPPTFAICLSVGRGFLISIAWPQWFTQNCTSQPSLVRPVGAAMMPALQKTQSSLLVSRAMRAPASLVLARSVISHGMKVKRALGLSALAACMTASAASALRPVKKTCGLQCLIRV